MIKISIISFFCSASCYLTCLLFSYLTHNNLYIELFFIIISIFFQSLNFISNKTSRNWFSFFVQGILYSIFFCFSFSFSFLFFDIGTYINSIFISLLILFTINIIIALSIIYLILKNVKMPENKEP